MKWWVFWMFKSWRHAYLNIHGILNIQKVPSWVILNIHEAKSWVFSIFMKWRHGHFECSEADVKWIFKSWRRYSWNDLMGILNIQKLTSLTFWIFMRWCHWYFEYEVTPRVFWIFIVTLVFLIFIQYYVVFEYS